MNEEEKRLLQINEIKNGVTQLAQNLPMSFLMSQKVFNAELRWEKTKNWRSNAKVIESDQFSFNLDGVGRILVQVEYLTEKDLKGHILAD